MATKTISRKAANEQAKQNFLATLIPVLEDMDFEVLRTGSNEVALPFVNGNGDDEYFKITIQTPTGSRADNEPYDGYAAAQDYEMKKKEKEEKATAAAIAKEKKIKRDEEYRAKKAAAKEEQAE